MHLEVDGTLVFSAFRTGTGLSTCVVTLTGYFTSLSWRR
jgi:hypothetical protein